MEKLQELSRKVIFETKNEYLTFCLEEIEIEEGQFVLSPHITHEKWNKKIRKYSQQFCLAIYNYSRSLGYEVMFTFVHKDDTKHKRYLSTVGNWKATDLTFEGYEDYIVCILDLNNYIGEI